MRSRDKIRLPFLSDSQTGGFTGFFRRRAQFAHAGANPDGYGAVFGRAMSGFSAIQSGWALEALRDYDFSSVADWCDVEIGRAHV